MTTQQFKKETAQGSINPPVETNFGKKKSEKAVDIVSYTYDKQSEGVAEMFKTMSEAFSSTNNKNCK